MLNRFIFFLILSFSFVLTSLSEAQNKQLKIYISVDMEGVAGVVTGDQLGPAGFEYQRFRKFMTDETLAAVKAARRAGATEILISDSHGNGENLLVEEFPDFVRIIRSWPRKLGMMEGIDQTFAAAIFIGYHAPTTSLRGTRAHTFSSAKLTRVALNGKAVSEAVWNAALAGHFGVPVVMISGDDALYEDIRPVLGHVEFAETQKTISFHSANCLTPAASCRLIEQKVTAAFNRLSDFKPFILKTPVTLEVSFKHYRPVELLSYLRTVQRIDSHTISFTGEDMTEISEFLEFITGYSADIEP